MVKKFHVQKRYLLWPLRNIRDILNGSDISLGDSFKDMFEKELSFIIFYKFIKVPNSTFSIAKFLRTPVFVKPAKTSSCSLAL